MQLHSVFAQRDVIHADVAALQLHAHKESASAHVRQHPLALSLQMMGWRRTSTAIRLLSALHSTDRLCPYLPHSAAGSDADASNTVS
jgi:hypothetical protein